MRKTKMTQLSSRDRQFYYLFRSEFDGPIDIWHKKHNWIIFKVL